jgi:hypothetical protein
VRLTRPPGVSSAAAKNIEKMNASSRRLARRPMSRTAQGEEMDMAEEVMEPQPLHLLQPWVEKLVLQPQR